MAGNPKIALLNAKLTDDDKRLIRELVSERRRLEAEARKLSNEAIAEKFQIKPVTVSRVANYYVR